MLLTYEHTDKNIIQSVWVLSSGYTDVLGDVILCCGIGNILGLGITAVVLRVSVRAFDGIVNLNMLETLVNYNDRNNGPLSNKKFNKQSAESWQKRKRKNVTPNVMPTM